MLRNKGNSIFADEVVPERRAEECVGKQVPREEPRGGEDSRRPTRGSQTPSDAGGPLPTSNTKLPFQHLLHKPRCASQWRLKQELSRGPLPTHNRFTFSRHSTVVLALLLSSRCSLAQKLPTSAQVAPCFPRPGPSGVSEPQGHPGFIPTGAREAQRCLCCPSI